MKLTVSARQMTLRDSLKEMVEDKLRKFDRYFDDQAEAIVTFSHRRNMEMIEITIISGGTLFRSEEGADTFRTALDSAVDTLDRQIRKNKTRLMRRIREGAFVDLPDNDVEEEEGPFKVRTKTYPIRPMSTEEAILQMNLLGHQFFVFVNSDDDQTCVVYRRRDGDYGIIIPE